VIRLINGRANGRDPGRVRSSVRELSRKKRRERREREREREMENREKDHPDSRVRPESGSRREETREIRGDSAVESSAVKGTREMRIGARCAAVVR